MKFNSNIQHYQTDAVDSMFGVFKGQPYSNPISYRKDKKSLLPDEAEEEIDG